MAAPADIIAAVKARDAARALVPLLLAHRTDLDVFAAAAVDRPDRLAHLLPAALRAEVAGWPVQPEQKPQQGVQ